MKKFTIGAVTAASLLTMGGCASIKPEPITGPNGEQGFTMRCSGYGRTLEDCYAEAGKVCPNGYSVVGQNSSMVAIPTSNGGTMAAPQHNLTIECKPS
ncbi:MAG: hypothetical protein ABJL54_16005 [Halioglobus sp.]